MPAISIEEAHKQFDKRYSRLILPEKYSGVFFGKYEKIC